MYLTNTDMVQDTEWFDQTKRNAAYLCLHRLQQAGAGFISKGSLWGMDWGV